MENIEKLLGGGDLRSLGKSNILIKRTYDPNRFDDLFKLLYHSDRRVAMRAADVIEKITRTDNRLLKKHGDDLLKLMEIAINKELKWHLALLMPRITLSEAELGKVWHMLVSWALDKSESRIVRVNALQGMYDLLLLDAELTQDFNLIVDTVALENIPSITARLKKLKIFSQ